MNIPWQVHLILFFINLGITIVLYPRRTWKWFAASTLFWLTIVIMGCSSTHNKPKCTWYCADLDKIPESCYCLEEMIDANHP
jgi:hypothetical protein